MTQQAEPRGFRQDGEEVDLGHGRPPVGLQCAHPHSWPERIEEPASAARCCSWSQTAHASWRSKRSNVCPSSRRPSACACSLQSVPGAPILPALASSLLSVLAGVEVVDRAADRVLAGDRPATVGDREPGHAHDSLPERESHLDAPGPSAVSAPREPPPDSTPLGPAPPPTVMTPAAAPRPSERKRQLRRGTAEVCVGSVMKRHGSLNPT